jgi:hypothetical protein
VQILPPIDGGSQPNHRTSSPSSSSNDENHTRTRRHSFTTLSDGEYESFQPVARLTRLSQSPETHADPPVPFVPQARALRQRSRIQLEPYTLERQQYRALLARGGAKDAVIRDNAERAAVSAQMRRENEDDGSCEMSQNMQSSSPASSGIMQVHSASSRVDRQPDQFQALFPSLSDDDDLPLPATARVRPFIRSDEGQPLPVSGRMHILRSKRC